MLSILTQFLSNQSQHNVVDGCWSKLVNDMPGALQGMVLGPLLFLLYTLLLFSILENGIPCCFSADDSTVIAVVIDRRWS